MISNVPSSSDSLKLFSVPWGGFTTPVFNVLIWNISLPSSSDRKMQRGMNRNNFSSNDFQKPTVSDDSEDRQCNCPGATGKRGGILESPTRAAWYSPKGPPEMHKFITCSSCFHWEWARGDKNTANMRCPGIRMPEWEGTIEIMHFNSLDS